MKGKIVFLSTALAGALAAASAAHAVDVKVYPGSACQPFLGSQAGDFEHFSQFIINAGAGTRGVVCPIVRDNHNNLDGVKSVGVRVRSPNGTTLTCFLESYAALGNVVTQTSNSTTSTVATNLPLDINISTKGGIYSLYCDLPSDGRVLGYRVTEF